MSVAKLAEISLVDSKLAKRKSFFGICKGQVVNVCIDSSYIDAKLYDPCIYLLIIGLKFFF